MHFKYEQRFYVSTCGVHCRVHCALTGFGNAIAVYSGYRCTQAWTPASQPPTFLPSLYCSPFLSHHFTKTNKQKLETPETDILNHEVHLGTLPFDIPQLAARDCHCVFQPPQDLARDKCIMKLSSQKWPGGIGGYQTSSLLPARDTFTL